MTSLLCNITYVSWPKIENFKIEDLKIENFKIEIH